MDKIGKIFLSLIVGILVARYLGPEQFGVIGFVLSVYVIFKCFSSVGMEQIIVKELAKGRRADELYATYFTLRLIFGFCLLVLAFFLVFFSYNEMMFFSLPLFAVLVFHGLDFSEWNAQANGKSKRIVKLSFLAALMSGALKLSLIYFEANLKYFILSLSFDALALLLAAYFSKCSFLPFSPGFSLSGGKGLIGQSWPLMLSSIAVILYMKMDVLMLFYFLGEYETGIYSVAAKMSEALYFLPSVLLSALFPLLVKLKISDIKEYRRGVLRLLSFLNFFAVGYSIGILFFADYLIFTLFGDEYKGASEILRVHAFACLAVFPGVVFRRMAIVDDFQRLTLISTLVGLLANFILNITLIPLYGGLGAAIATLVSRLISSIVFYGFFKNTRCYLFLYFESLMPQNWALGVNFCWGKIK